MATLALLISRVADPAPVLAQIEKNLLDGIEQGFRTQTDPAGVPWKRLKASTLRKKRGPSILHEKGRLRRSIKHRRKFRRRDEVGVELGPNMRIPYARIHQMGGTAGFGAKIPERRYIGATTRFPNTLPSILRGHYVV